MDTSIRLQHALIAHTMNTCFCKVCHHQHSSHSINSFLGSCDTVCVYSATFKGHCKILINPQAICSLFIMVHVNN